MHNQAIENKQTEQMDSTGDSPVESFNWRPLSAGKELDEDKVKLISFWHFSVATKLRFVTSKQVAASEPLNARCDNSL